MDRNLSSILIFCIIFVFIITFFYFFINQAVLALQGDYVNKTIGAGGTGYITGEEWNYLDEDFFKKEGDVMGGDLGMGGNYITGLASPNVSDLSSLASIGFVNNSKGKGAKDRTGTELNIICGSTAPGASGWMAISSKNVIDVDTRTGGAFPALNFTSTPLYFVSLGGDIHTWYYDNMAIYNPTEAGFRVVLNLNFSPVNLEDWRWHINWCGIGN